MTGIGPKRAERITAGWAEKKMIREIMLSCTAMGRRVAQFVFCSTCGADVFN
jgi:hypothetical protein